MAEEGFKRKLTAILSADVEGYGRLMDDDEEATVRTLTAYRTAISDFIQQYSGRVVDSPGDNILAEFKSVVDTVNCAVEIQRDLTERNADLPDDRKMQFRIGVNLGDVIDEENRIYGDGVNIAARIESLSDAGGICISHSAYDQIKNKLKFGYEYIGEHKVKNIREPVKAYRVLMAPEFEGKFIGFDKKVSNKRWIWVATAVVVAVIGFGTWQFYGRRLAIEPATVEKMAFPLPEKPSIAVLAFDNMSGDPEQEYFSDGLSEEIITALSKVPYLFVIARNSTFSYKGKPVKTSQVAEELGVRYVLEGSVRKDRDKVRVTAQLIDAIKGHYLWAERYERELKDTFALQDEITRNILSALYVKLTKGEQATIRRKGTDNLEAYLKALQAGWYLRREATKEGHIMVRRLGEEAMALAPEYAGPYLVLAGWHLNEVFLGWSKSRKESLKHAFELAQKAISLDDSYPMGYVVLSNIYMFKRQYEKAISEAERAINLDPNRADAYSMLGAVLNMVGRSREAIEPLEMAIRINPIAPSVYYRRLGAAYQAIGRYKEAIVQLKKAVNLSPDSLWPHVSLAATYSLAGRDEEARFEASEVLRIQPKFSLDSFAKRVAFKHKADIDRLVGALRKAGLPEHPPLKLPDKPSIAVLAFDNLSGDPEQEYFSDGIAEEIITVLSQVDELFVISRNSSFSYKGKPVKVSQVSRELGVQYILEGSIRRSGDRVRITAQLIDAIKGHHLWADKYDRDFTDIFEIQDEITRKIVTALRVELTEGEQARFMSKTPVNSDVFMKILKANSHWNKGTKEGILLYGELAQEIVDMAPDYPGGYNMLGWYHNALAERGKIPRENIKKAFEFAQKTLLLDESNGFAHALLGKIYLVMRQYEKAIESGKRAVELQPNGALAHHSLGTILDFAGHIDEAIAHLNQAIRLDPFRGYYYYYSLGRCYTQNGQYEDAITEYNKALQRAPNAWFIHLSLGITYSLVDREEEARASVAKALELNPNISMAGFPKMLRWKDQAFNQLLIDAARKAGVPE